MAVIDRQHHAASDIARLRGLYAVTPDRPDTDMLMAMVAAAIAGGAQAVQYRNKSAALNLQREQAAALTRTCRAAGALLIVNDDARIALECGAHGVHLGQDDADVAEARKLLGPRRIIGVSCYDDPGRAQRLVTAGADYVAFGSFFASQVKPDARRAELALLGSARALGVPVVAIGGITAGNARTLFAAGADAVAVISDVFGRGDAASITRAAAAIAACFTPA